LALTSIPSLNVTPRTSFGNWLCPSSRRQLFCAPDAGKGGAAQPAKGKKPKKAATGQREMLMAIAGKGEGKAKPAAKETKRPTRQRKAG